MTEGIIQKAIYEFVQSLGYTQPKNQVMFMRLQDKLIADIKKVHSKHKYCNCDFLMEELIGDN